jgi:hypothetical protein
MIHNFAFTENWIKYIKENRILSIRVNESQHVKPSVMDPKYLEYIFAWFLFMLKNMVLRNPPNALSLRIFVDNHS